MLGCSCLSPSRQVKAWICCTLLLRFYVSGQLNLFITKQQMKSSLDVDINSDLYFIENGRVRSFFKETSLLQHFMKPLAESMTKVQFTWRSHPLGISYKILTWSEDEEVMGKPHVSVPLVGTIPRYENIFTISSVCTGKKKGVVGVGFSLNYTSGTGYDMLRLVVPRQCDSEGKGKSDEGAAKKTTPLPAPKRTLVVALSAAMAVFLCFVVCICCYYRYYKRTRRLQMKFDREYELAAKQEVHEIKKDDYDLLNHVYEEEEDDAPRRPIFVPKKKHSRLKKWKTSSRHRRSLRLPVEANQHPQPVYAPSPSTPSSPGSLTRVLENIPEEHEEIKEDTEEECDEENKPMLTRKIRSNHHIVNISNIRENPANKIPNGKCRNTESGNMNEEAPSTKQETEPAKCYVSSNGDDSDDLYKVLNDHWKQQFEGKILQRDQVTVEQRPFSKGAYGYVCRGRARGTCQQDKVVPVAVKLMKDSLEFETISCFVSEGLIMSKFNHKNILKLFGIVIQASAPPMIVVPYMKHGDLNQFLRNSRATPRKPQLLSTRQLVNFGLQISRGMEYLASHRYVHRDLATRNCMVSEDLEIKISDFGLAKEMGSDESYLMERKTKLPIKWMSMESLNGFFSEKSDVWSFGVVQWEIMTLGKQPYSGVDSSSMEEHLLRGNRLAPPKYCPSEIYTIMRLCWRQDATERPDFKELCLRIAAYESRYDKYSLDYTSSSSSHSQT